MARYRRGRRLDSDGETYIHRYAGIDWEIRPVKEYKVVKDRYGYRDLKLVTVARDLYYYEDDGECVWAGEFKMLWEAEEAIYGERPHDTKPRGPKDSQRQKMYNSERPLRSTRGGRKFATQDEIEEYINQITADPWWQENFPWTATVQLLKDFRGRNWSHGGGLVNETTRYVQIAPQEWAMNELVVLHEVAHCVARDWQPWHSREFCTFLLILPERYHSQGNSASVALELNYIRNGVKYITIEEAMDKARELAAPYRVALKAATRGGEA